MDLAWSPEQLALREQARQVAAEAVAEFGRHNDSWINGYSKDFAKRMAELGWIGLTWPTEFGGQGRPPVDRLIIGEELIAAGLSRARLTNTYGMDRSLSPASILGHSSVTVMGAIAIDLVGLDSEMGETAARRVRSHRPS